MKFRSHGEWDIKVLKEKRIILIKGRGGWNENAATEYSRHFHSAANELAGTDWVSVGYGMEWELGTPAIEPILQNLYRWMVENGSVHQLAIMRSPISKAQIATLANLDSLCYSMRFV